jgi:hypothetical protein
MGRIRDLGSWLGRLVEKIDARVDKPAKDRGTFTSGSEQMIDSDMPAEMGRSTSNRRSGFLRRF